MKRLVGALALVVAFLVGAAGFAHHSTRTIVLHSTVPAGAETVYIRNLDPVDYTDRQIRHAIPAWEHAINVDFAKYWGTSRYRLVFLGRKPAPYGAIVATFLKKGPIKGALAYHNVLNGAPSITVYSGTGRYYGFDNSVSFTHELEEMAADRDISTVKQGWPYDYYWTESPDGGLKQGFQLGVYGWFGEVSDPVEEDSYRIGDVAISDFITPAWFNAGQGQVYDFMGLCQQPFWIRPGGYAQYLDANGWQIVTNFRHGHPADRGFVKGDGRR